MAKEKVGIKKRACEKCGEDIVDRKQSNHNWTVYSAKCPGCGEATNKQVLAIILESANKTSQPQNRSQ